jgi:foldase protein PrsA
MKYGRNLEAKPVGSQKRRLKTKPLLVVIGTLFVVNVLWFIGWLIPDKPVHSGGHEEVASVAGKPITKEQWMTAMEEKVGRETLLDLVNEQVMAEAAERYNIAVADKEIDLEIALIRSVDGYAYSGMDLEKMRQKIRSTLILEKVLTKDVVIKEDAIENYYKENSSIFNTVTTYRTAVIIVPSKGEAEQALEELSKGSSFDVLAKERSTDFASGSLGGDIGYLNASTDSVDPAIVDTATGMKEGATSDVVALEDGSYAIVRVSEVMKGQSFNFEEVKEHIRRELAMEQLTQSVSPEAFWKEFDAKWFYGK